MEKQTRNKQNRRLGVRGIILLITSLPMLVTCVIITAFAGVTMEKGMQNEVFITLRGVATGALIALDNASMDAFCLVGDELYKGDYNVSQNMAALDNYAQSNGVEITFFYGDTRRATTIIGEDGERANGTKADEEVISAVLKKGETYTTTSIIINNEHYYGYYMPLQDFSTGEIIGMVFAGESAKEIDSYIQTKTNFIILIAVVIYLICLAVVAVVTEKRFLSPIQKLQGVARLLAAGDVNQKIERETNDEFGDLTQDFADMMNNIKNQAHITELVAEGDLTVTCTPVCEADVMGNAIKKMVNDNNRNLSVIRDAIERVASGSREVAGASGSLAEGTTQQASAIEEITAFIKEIENGARINADDAGKANELVQSTKQEAVCGNEQMRQMLHAMQAINESSENISKIMKVIDDIAFQTNILALNASVEAARAGEHGKGFAVVADEVRNLASKSAEAAKNSAEMIEDSIRKIRTGSELAAETEAALEEILNSVGNIADLISRITEASANQAGSVSQVNMGITQIADVVQTNSAASQECAAASAELSSLAGRLQQAVSKYKLQAKGNFADD